MKIFCTNLLNVAQKNAVRSLEEACRAHDGVHNIAFLSNEINFDTAAPCFFLGYEKETPVGFLTLFMPTREEAEITAFVLPSARRKGYFAALVSAAKQELKARGIARVLFCVENTSADGCACAQSLSLHTPHHSEYRMSTTCVPSFISSAAPEWQRVTPHNFDTYKTLVCGITPELAENESFLQAVLTDPARAAYIGFCANTPAVSFALNRENAESFLYCVGVGEAFRRRGLCKAAVQFAATQSLQNTPRMVLDVDSENPPALAAYRACGLQTDFRTDYYSLEI